MTDEELVALVDMEFTSAMGAAGGDISKERANAWDFYLSKKMGDETEGQSKVRTSDVSDAVDGIMPSLLRIFTTADNVISFDAVGEEDVEAAEQESDYVNYVFFKQNPSFEIMYVWFFDALVQKNGITKVWWDDTETVSTETYRGLSDAELAELFADEELEPLEHSERQAEVATQTGITIDVVHDIEFRRVRKRGQVRIENVPPEEYRISADARSLDPSRARMVGQEREVTRSELLEMGFDKEIVDNLSAVGEFNDSSEEISRHDKSDEDDIAAHDRSQDKILLREAYIRVDFDEDGRSELRQVFSADNRLLSNEIHDRQPFHVISPQPLPHKHFGQALSEKVMDVQEVTTALVRQILDNLYHTNRPGHGVWKMGMGDTTMSDLLTTRVGRVVEFNRPMQESYQALTVPFTAGATFPMLDYWNKVKRDRTGISSDSEGLSPEALKNIQISVLSAATDISKLKQEAIARIFAETGIKSAFGHIHELVQKNQQDVEIVKLRGKFVEINPQEWRERKNMTVNVGLGIGTREQNLLHLDAIWQKQTDMIGAGGLGTLVTPRNWFNTASEIVKNANLKDPEMFFTLADEIQPQSDGQQELLQLQAQLQARQQELEFAKLQLDQAEASLLHQRESEKIAIMRDKQQDDLLVRMEQLQNQLTEFELKFGVNVPGSKV